MDVSIGVEWLSMATCDCRPTCVSDCWPELEQVQQVAKDSHSWPAFVSAHLLYCRLASITLQRRDSHSNSPVWLSAELLHNSSKKLRMFHIVSQSPLELACSVSVFVCLSVRLSDRPALCLWMLSNVELLPELHL